MFTKSNLVYYITYHFLCLGEVREKKDQKLNFANRFNVLIEGLVQYGGEGS